jgi:putative NIF3 family GTP cyclohydrolase 1 type 2
VLLREIYELAIKKGKENDLRGIEEVEKLLAKTKKKYEKMNKEEKQEFDTEKLTNPYSDTRILCGDENKEIKTILAGIDMEIGEVLLADRLKEKGEPVDLILAHHPEGKALAGLYEVMHLQEDLLRNLGVPIGVAEGIMTSRIKEVERGLLPANHNRAVDAAKLLDFAMMCIHTPADNMVTNYLQKMLDETEPETVEDIIKELKKIPEYQHASSINAGPKVVVGSKSRRAGKIFVDMTGGTGGSEDAYSKLSAAGVSTLVVMHIGEKHRKEAEKNHINVIIAGHYASDSLGMNLLLDEIEKKGVKIIACSGLHRVSRI